MSAKIISGTETAKAIREELKVEIAELKEKHNVVPGLVTILVGEDPASQSYVTAKGKTCKALGIYSEQVNLPADTNEEELLSIVDKYNNDDKINGILDKRHSRPTALTKTDQRSKYSLCYRSGQGC